MQAEWPVAPELDAQWRNPEARPEGRTRNLANAKLGRELRHVLFQRMTAFQRARLARGPSPIRLSRARLAK